jgi:hypothetical protein
MDGGGSGRDSSIRLDNSHAEPPNHKVKALWDGLAPQTTGRGRRRARIGSAAHGFSRQQRCVSDHLKLPEEAARHWGQSGNGVTVLARIRPTLGRVRQSDGWATQGAVFCDRHLQGDVNLHLQSQILGHV